MIKSSPEAILQNCTVTSSETISICWWCVWFDLVLKKVAQFYLELKPGTLLRCCRCRRGWGGCNIIARPWDDLRVQPHVRQNLTDAFFNFLAKRTISCKTIRRLFSKINREQNWTNAHAVNYNVKWQGLFCTWDFNALDELWNFYS